MQKPLSVFELNTQIKTILEETFLSVYVEGEISNLTIHSSGHIYFSLKDSQSSISCVLFRGNSHHLDFELQEGLKVQVIGGLSVYPPRGNYQILCKKILSPQEGDLSQKYEKLKKKLENKGYFASKKPLPPFPKKVALLTSITGAALQDMLKIAHNRWKLTKFYIINTLVQGENAKEEIAKNLAFADTLGFDVIVLARGGGSKEDLWAFNEEIVADAIFNAKTPIISAIGHETDFLISDFVADYRAPTPTGAMEILLPDSSQWFLYLDDLIERLNGIFLKILRLKSLEIQSLQESFKNANYATKIQMQTKECNQIRQLLDLRFSNLLNHQENQFQTSIQAFLSLNPLKHFETQLSQIRSSLTLCNPTQKCQNGYAQITQKGKIIPLENLQDGEVFELTNAKKTILAKKLPKV